MIVSQQTLAPPRLLLPPTVPSLDGNQGAPQPAPNVRELHTIGPEPPPDPSDPKETVSNSVSVANSVTPLLTNPCLTLPRQQYSPEIWTTKIQLLISCDPSAPIHTHCPPPPLTSETPHKLEKQICYMCVHNAERLSFIAAPLHHCPPLSKSMKPSHWVLPSFRLCG